MQNILFKNNRNGTSNVEMCPGISQQSCHEPGSPLVATVQGFKPKGCDYPFREDRRVCDSNELGFVHVVDDVFPSGVLSALEYQDSIACTRSWGATKV
jgi:hypothetical protein